MNAAKHNLNLGNALNDLRKQNQLCDVTINIGGRAFHVHKAVLAACSGYFMAMFTSGFSESTQSEINIDGDADIFEMLMEFTYTGKMKVTAETAYDILEMACYMQLTDVCETCSIFIGNCYDRQNSPFHMYRPAKPDEIVSIGDVYKIAKLASCHDTNDHLKQLAQKSMKYLCKNLKLLKSSDVFLQTADMNFINSFLKRQFLSSKEEEKEVVEIVVNWLKHDWSSRATHALKLLQKVRLGFVPGETLKNLLDATILEIPGCKQLVDKVLGLQTSNHSAVTLARDFPKLFATRSTVTAPLVSTSTYDGYPSTFYYYDLKNRKWTMLPKFESLHHLASLIVVNESLYAVGGIHVMTEEKDSDSSDDYYGGCEFDRELVRECRGDILCYNAEKNEWKTLPSSMKTARHSFKLVHMDGFIYAIGGSDEDDSYHEQPDMFQQMYVDKVERYDMEKMVWQDVASLPEGFTCESAVVFQDNLLVYGVAVQDKRKHMLVVYDSNSDTWASKLSEQNVPVSDESLYWRPQPTPALFVHKDVCYRVLYHKAGKTIKASVNLLKISKSRSNVTIEVGEAIQQDQIPVNNAKAFRIEDEVFVNIDGYISKTDLKISADPSINVNLNKWKGPIEGHDLHRSNVVSLTIDIKKISSNW